MAIQLNVTLPDDQQYDYWKIDLLSIARTDAGDPTALTVTAQYQLYKNATAFGVSATSGASLRVNVVVDVSAVGGVPDALETLIDDAVIAASMALQVQGVAFNTSSGVQVS